MNSGMTVKIWGVRGSIPTPGPNTFRYGGNTSCVSVEIGPFLLILDAGSGIRPLGKLLAASDRPILIFLTHLHWDHVQGLVFFAPLYQPGRVLTLKTPDRQTKSLEKIAGIDGIHFPLKPYQIGSALAINRRDPTRALHSYGIRMRRLRVNHPGICEGFRIEYGGRTFVYIPDNEIDPPYPKTVEWPELVEFCRDADLLIHDAQYVDADMPLKRGWGHSVVSQVCELAAAAAVKEVLLFHHDPERGDDALDAIQESARKWFSENAPSIKCSAAMEGMEYHFDRR